ncbi:MAG: 50S ribosomal protein L33 [Candidatus Moranbacteria bacterium]|nr:50S ribosomal protein L33 [Candidatus Moranbacteria bacterium]
MSRIQENYVKLKCNKCGKIGYTTRKNKKKLKIKLELNKFCQDCHTHTQHKEIK